MIDVTIKLSNGTNETSRTIQVRDDLLGPHPAWSNDREQDRTIARVSQLFVDLYRELVRENA